MEFSVPQDRDELKQQVLAYMAHMGAEVSDALAAVLSARYIPGGSAAEGSVAVRLLNVGPGHMADFDGVMDTVGADIRNRDDGQTIRLDNWAARWASTLSPAPLIFIGGPTRSGSIVAEFFDETAEVPAGIFQNHPDGRLFTMEHGLPR